MREALETIYREHRQGLFSLALSVTRCPARAEDAVQDAFANLYRLNKTPTGDPVPYVYSAVRNAAVSQLRKLGNESPAADVSVFDTASLEGRGAVTESAAEREAMENEEHRLVAKAVEALPTPQREVIVLHLYAGLTFDQIAKALGEPLQTIASRYRRTLERLRKEIEVLR